MIIRRATALARSCSYLSKVLSGIDLTILRNQIVNGKRNPYDLSPSSSTASRGFSTSCLALYSIPSSIGFINELSTDAHHAAAKQWVEGFKVEDIPKEAMEVTFARSSGPGGQHVNKTNSKAIIRCSLDGSWLPSFVHAPLRSSPHYLPNPPSLLVASQTSRSAPQNQAAALALLHQTITSAARSVIKGTTSHEQKKKVESLIRREEGRRRIDKDRLKSKKASRRE